MKLISDILWILYGVVALVIGILYRLTEGHWNPAIMVFAVIMLLLGIGYYFMLVESGVREW